ncbi:MAG: gliding motility-associated C-terminal domain-containing protein [Bacteroidetes bacterium]|nr:gliding motility-associated C-terminal domain-containing protein [Bacteroidota bacterium]
MKHIHSRLLLACTLLYAIASNAQPSQPTICPINAGPNQSVCVPTCANLSGTFTPTFQTNTYSMSTIPYTPDPFTVGTALVLGDDQWSSAIPLPFTFCYFGNPYTQLLIGSNGALTFDLTPAGGYCQWPISAAMPTASDPVMIGGPWQDLYPPGGGTIKYTTYGVAPCRRFVVSWYQVPMYSCTTTLCTQQLTLYETTNVIDNYLQSKGLCTGWNGGNAIQGIQNPAFNTAFVQAGRNYPTQWSAVNDAKRWQPAGAATSVVSWYQGATAIATVVNNGTGIATATVCPVATTTYTLQEISTNCNATTATVTSTMTVTVSSLTLSGTQTNNVCSSSCTGTATTTVVSGTGPFTYLWTPAPGGGQGTATATGLCAGTYSCTVTGAGGCQGTQTFTITANPPITDVPSHVNVSCNAACNGSATVVASGGTGTYTYSWAPVGGTSATATGLCAGNYTCTISSPAGCTITQTFTITQPTALTATQSQGTILCNGGTTTASVVASGGTPAYTYNWTPSGGTGATSTPLGAGSYTCTITDANGCSITKTFTIAQPTAITATSTSSTATCGSPNGSATVTPSGGTPGYTYSWAPSGGTGSTASGLTAGTYTCTITDANGCSITKTVTVSSTNSLSATITGNVSVSCNGGNNGSATVTPVGGNPGFTYSWSPTGGTGATGVNLTAGNYTVTVNDAGGCSATATVTITQPTAVTATQSQTNVTCNGGNNGTATVVASGGTPAYSYSWAPSGGTSATASGLSAGTYTCTITDANGCLITKIFTITQATAITATTSSTQATCGNPNGTATVTPSGGTPGYTYSWAPSGGTGSTASGLGTGTYTCTITDAAGCSITKTVTITNAGSPTATITSSTNISCFGGNNGSATVSASGGTGPYTYSWSPIGGTGTTASSLTANTYTVTVTDANGCSNIATVTLTQPTALTATATASPVLCNGGNTGSAAVTPAGGSPAYSYSWSPSGGTGATTTGVGANTYTCTVTDSHGCTTTATATVTQPTALTATTSQVNVLCNGALTGSATVNASGGTPAYSYSWAPSGGTSATASGLGAGTFTCTITDANGCSITKIFTITQPTALSATTSSTQSTCGNPNGSASVVVSGGTPAYSYSWAPSGGTGSTASGLASNIYTVTITDANGCSLTATANVTNAGSPTATITSSTNVSCFGGNNGSATVSAAGGTGPYTYNWTPAGGTGITASGLTALNYSVTVTDANGCTATASVLITQPTALAATASSSPVLCNGGNTGSATVTITGGTSAYTQNWTPIGGTGTTANNLTAQTYTCTVIDANGCSTTATTTVTQPTALTITGTQTNVNCNGGNTGVANVTVGGGTPVYTYSWSPTGGTGATAMNLPAQNYTCTATDGNGCIITQTFAITEPPLLTVTTTTVSSTCGNPNGSATATPAGGTPPYFYSWSSGGTAATETGLSANTYTVTVTDNKGCTATAVVTITNMGSPTVTITSSSNVLCFGGNTGSATSNGTGGTGVLTYAWSNGGTNPTDNNLSAGTYTITVTDVNGCQDTAQVIITQPPVLTVSTTQADELCNGGSTASTNAIPAGGVTAYSYLWSNGVTTSTNSGILAGNYSVVVTDANGCTANANVTIIEPTALALTTSQVDETCFGGSTGSATVTATGATPTYGYLWSNASAAATTSNLTAGLYTVNVTDANGCTASATVTITEPTQVTAVATEVDAHCNQSDGSATVTGGGGTPGPGYTYLWSNGGTTATISNIPSGTYNVTVTDANGCSATTSVTVNNLNGVNTSVNSTTNILCNGNTTGQILINYGGGNGPYNFAWTPNVSANDSANNIGAGTYTCVVTDANGCSSTATATLTQPAALTVTASASPPAVCAGSSVQLNANPTGGVGPYTVTWGPIGMTGTSPNYTPAASGVDTVYVVDANGCTTNTTVNVIVFAMPVVSFTSNIQAGCDPVCVSFSDLSTVANPAVINAWTWDFGDGNNSSSQNPGHCYSVSGSYNVTLTVKTQDGCLQTITMNSYITVHPNPVAAFSASPQPTTILDPMIDFTDASTGATAWSWSFGDLVGTSTNENPSYTYPSVVDCYQVVLTVTSVDGCVDTVSHPVCLEPDVMIYVPNAFTPDGNNTNDIFNAVCLGIDPDKFQMWIYDRWGNQIFYTDDINKGWDGRVMGHPDVAQIDTYVWKIKATDLLGKQHSLLGKVSLIK